jgi:hypothetical protein
MFALAAGVMLALVAAGPVSVKGTWEGKLSGQRPDGSAVEDTAYMVLDQKESEVTGTIGSSATDQHPISTGTVEGNKVSLLAKHAENGREYRVEVTIDGDDMKGMLFMGERKAELTLKRRKQ